MANLGDQIMFKGRKGPTQRGAHNCGSCDQINDLEQLDNSEDYSLDRMMAIKWSIDSFPLSMLYSRKLWDLYFEKNLEKCVACLNH